VGPELLIEQRPKGHPKRPTRGGRGGKIRLGGLGITKKRRKQSSVWSSIWKDKGNDDERGAMGKALGSIGIRHPNSTVISCEGAEEGKRASASSWTREGGKRTREEPAAWSVGGIRKQKVIKTLNYEGNGEGGLR